MEKSCTRKLAERANKLETMKDPYKWQEWLGACRLAVRYGLITASNYTDFEQCYVDAMYALNEPPKL